MRGDSRQLKFTIWETTVSRGADGHARLEPVAPVATLSVPEAGNLMGLGRDRVRRLYQEGHLEGWKPGGGAIRRDGKASNARLRLDAASVLRYISRQRRLARQERGLE